MNTFNSMIYKQINDVWEKRCRMSDAEITARYSEHNSYINARGNFSRRNMGTAYILEYGFILKPWVDEDYSEFMVEGVEVFFNEIKFNQRKTDLTKAGYECVYYHGTVSKGR